MSVTAKDFTSTFTSRALGSMLYDALIQNNALAVEPILKEMIGRKEFELVEKVIDDAFDGGWEFKPQYAIKFALEKCFRQHLLLHPYFHAFYRFLVSGEYEGDFSKIRYEQYCKDDFSMVDIMLSALTPEELSEMKAETFSEITRRLISILEYEKPQEDSEELRKLAHQQIRERLKWQIDFIAKDSRLMQNMRSLIRRALLVDERRDEILQHYANMAGT